MHRFVIRTLFKPLIISLFLLSCEDRKPLDDRHICENAPESDDEFDYNFDEFDTDFIDGEDEFIVTQPDGCPLRKVKILKRSQISMHKSDPL